MPTRKTPLAVGEIYHVYNRGVDKRNIVEDLEDTGRFLESVKEFNSMEAIGSIYENRFRKEEAKRDFLVEFIAFILNPNHYHFLFQQVAENGIQKYMQRLGNGYTKYFNNKHKRSGPLFQGSFKAVRVLSNEQLCHLSVYINLNDKVHQLGHRMSKLVTSSMREYTGEVSDDFLICKGKDLILDQFKNRQDYQIYAEDVLPDILERKTREKEFRTCLLE